MMGGDGPISKRLSQNRSMKDPKEEHGPAVLNLLVSVKHTQNIVRSGRSAKWVWEFLKERRPDFFFSFNQNSTDH
jgi:hypothetical protein